MKNEVFYQIHEELREKYLGYRINKDVIICGNSFKTFTVFINLYKLLREETPFNWTTECEDASVKFK